MTQTSRQSAIAGPSVLVIEDEVETAGCLAEGLAGAGWRVRIASDGPEGARLAQDEAFEVLVVDRMLPGVDGLTLVSQLRDRGVETPVLFLTAMGTVADRVAGLESGGDDYLVKPFAFAELNARLGALARRPRAAQQTVLKAGGLELDRLMRTARRQGREIELLPLEFRLLEVLMLNAGRPVTRKMLLEKVWGFHFDPRTNIVETHISRLRAKLQAPGEPPLVTTLRGEGYIVAARAPATPACSS